MSLLIGLCSVMLLLVFTFILTYLFKYTHEYPMVLVGVMILGDMLLIGTWYLVGIEIGVDSEQSFKRGIALAFAFMSFGRALIFLVNAKKKGYL